jgi:hypothetical protein
MPDPVVETRFADERIDVLHLAGGQIIEDQDLMPLGEQPPCQMGADEPRAASDEDLHPLSIQVAVRAASASSPRRRAARCTISR